MSEGTVAADVGQPVEVIVQHDYEWYKAKYGAREAIPDFVRDVLHYEPWSKQLEMMEAYAEKERNISVPSGHRGGKSSCLSWLILHRLLFEKEQRTVATSNTEKQLFNVLCAEVSLNAGRLPPALADIIKVQATRADRLDLPRGVNYFVANTARSDQPEALSGIHSQGSVLLIVDEGAGVPEAVFKNAAGSMAADNAQMIIIGNPTRVSGMFWRTFTRLAKKDKDDHRPGRWRVIRINCEDSPLASQEFREDIMLAHGKESNEYRIRVLGLPPLLEDDVIIARELAESAMGRDVAAIRSAPKLWAIRLSHGGTDGNTLVMRKGNDVLGVETSGRAEARVVASWVRGLWKELPLHERPDTIYIDSIADGTKVREMLDGFNDDKVESLPVVGVNVREQPPLGVDRVRFANLQTQLFFRVRDWLEERNVRLPKHEGLADELSAVRYMLRNGAMIVDEDSTFDTLGRNACAAEALAMTFTDDLWGSAPDQSWNRPLHRS